MLNSYMKKMFEVANRGDAREESYYSILEGLLKEYTESVDKKNICITTLPKKTEAGNPDFRIWDGKQHIVGYIEAKAPEVDNLDLIEDSEQLKRYLDTFPNLILTNFFEFRLYRNGNLIDKVLIGRAFIMQRIKTTAPVERKADFLKLLEKFFSFSLPKVYDAETLATELAKRTRFLKDEVVTQELKEEEETGRRLILEFYEVFRKYLISGLSKEEFADLYSQTITYGLFAARTRSENGFNRKLAYDSIPHSIGILKDVFKFISLGDLPQPMEWIIDDISEVLAVTDVKNILHQNFHQGKGKDPIVHFYETFLAEYDPQTREKRGVYYTPEPVVSYIVRSLHNILKEHFNKADGFASEGVTVLDPAAGTLTFLAEAAKFAVEEFTSKFGEGGKEQFIKEYILKNFYAFELMMAPYAVGHLKISFLLEELGYRLHGDDRFKLYLTNTLEMEELAQTELPGMTSLSEESHLAGKVKKEQSILVILGNPPYSVSSANKSEFIEKEMEVYKEDVRKERNLQPLSDDYIKFLRFAHWKIDKAGVGIVGMITNNSYLSGLIHRGMRKKLMESFDKIYILNLHGNSRIGEKCPDGSKDENVFDIMQGVSIALFVKNKGIISSPLAGEDGGGGGRTGVPPVAVKAAAIPTPKVFYHDLYGLRENKYQYLNKDDVTTTAWKELQPIEPYYFFVEKDFAGQTDYDKFIAIPEIFKIYSSGVKTNRDHFMVDFDRKSLTRRISLMAEDTLDDDFFNTTFKLKNGKYWNTKREREKVKNNPNWKNQFLPYSYRPFDLRWIYYQPNLIEIGRGGASKQLMQHFSRENLGLVFMRQYLYASVKIYNYAFCVNQISDIRMFISNRGSAVSSPLYLYPEVSSGELPGHQESEKKPNLKPEFIKSLAETFGHQPTPEEIFYYIYAVLYSNTYRLKYAEFLKIDFPRIPFTRDFKLFQKMGGLGNRLIDLHLLKSPELDPPAAKFQGEGDNIVAQLKYEEEKVCINKNQYFEGIKKEAWEYQIGGYQVCSKWLKDRKGRRLSLDDIKHYCKIVTSLQKTIKIQKVIDAIYPEVEKATIEWGAI